MKPKIMDMKLLRSWGPCYDPIKHLPEDWTGDVFTILGHEKIHFQDKLWVIMRSDLVSDKLIRLFAVWCARQVQHLMKDERSLKALDVAEAFANGQATEAEMAAARDAARGAAWAAARDAARGAAWDAARGAARDAAWAAARDAARGAAWDAAMAAAWAAARDAAWAAAMDAAWGAAWDAAMAAARDAQQAKLREMLIAGIETGDVVCEIKGE